MKKTVFLDRDGVINEDSPEYIKSWDEFRFIPGSIQAVRDLTRNGFEIIVITNQSAIGRKMITPRELSRMHRKMKDELEAKGGKIRDIFFCPHLPEAGCGCRKPKAGLIRQAMDKYRIDLSRSSMVGDSAKDVECARNAGCGHAVLVRTGNGDRARKALLKKNISPDYFAADLQKAVEWILGLD